jgi:hypothetical protein
MLKLTRGQNKYRHLWHVNLILYTQFYISDTGINKTQFILNVIYNRVCDNYNTILLTGLAFL